MSEITVDLTINGVNSSGEIINEKYGSLSCQFRKYDYDQSETLGPHNIIRLTDFKILKVFEILKGPL